MKVTVTTIALILATLGVALAADAVPKTGASSAQPTTSADVQNSVDSQYQPILDQLSKDAISCFKENEKACSKNPEVCFACFGGQGVQKQTEKCATECVRRNGGDGESCASSCLASVLREESSARSTATSSATKSSTSASATKSAKATESSDGENDATSLGALSLVAAVPLALSAGWLL
ncbi:hypothetical protein IWQ61_008722 [Dispira simplex]|nr:hypothetical protein IWQ61_008722 [Dispira simplex]